MFEHQFPGQSGPIHYASSESGQASLLMLHGVTRRWQSCVPLVSSLAARWQLDAIDFRGHGKSARTPGRYRVIDYVADVIDFIDRESRQNVVIYGHSLGAMVAAAVAAEMGQRVAAIVMEDPPLHTMGRRIGETMLRYWFTLMRDLAGNQRSVGELAEVIADSRLFDPQRNMAIRIRHLRDGASLRFTAACLKQLDPETLDPVIAGQWLEGFDAEAIFERLRCPSLLIQADTESGGMLRDDDAEMIERQAANVTRVKLPDCGHLVHWSRTSELLSYLHAFLESLES